MRYKYIEFATPNHQELLANGASTTDDPAQANKSDIIMWALLSTFVIIILYDLIFGL
jgi:hypothetical protein